MSPEIVELRILTINRKAMIATLLNLAVWGLVLLGLLLFYRHH